jgi:LacI family transcriptional regulator
MQTNARSRATLRQVAALADVSIATASRAINGAVASPAAAARVMAAVDQLGYFPDTAARSLRMNRTMTIGVVFFSLKLPGALEMLASLSQKLDEHKYTVLIADTGGRTPGFDLILGRLLERRVDALLCVNPDGVGPVLDRYRDRGIPALALISRGRGAKSLPLVAPSLEPAASQAVLNLESHGHRRVCAALPGGAAGPFRQIFRRLDESSMKVDRMSPFEVGFSAGGALARLRQLGCTAVISTYPVGLQLLRACREEGVRIPLDLSVAVVGDEEGCQDLVEAPLSAIHVDMSALGTAAAATVLDSLGGSAPPRTTLVPVCTWIERGTTGPATR